MTGNINNYIFFTNRLDVAEGVSRGVSGTLISVYCLDEHNRILHVGCKKGCYGVGSSLHELGVQSASAGVLVPSWAERFGL